MDPKSVRHCSPLYGLGKRSWFVQVLVEGLLFLFFYQKGLLFFKLLDFSFCLLVSFVYNLYTLLHFSLGASIFCSSLPVNK